MYHGANVTRQYLFLSYVNRVTSFIVYYRAERIFVERGKHVVHIVGSSSVLSHIRLSHDYYLTIVCASMLHRIIATIIIIASGSVLRHSAWTT